MKVTNVNNNMTTLRTIRDTIQASAIYAPTEVKIAHDKSAKELFKELGYEMYELFDDTGHYIEYYKPEEECDSITFYLDSKTFCIGEYCLCDMRILKAINKQVLEMGWI